eukprot:6260916-Amphidinium_carterae.1
MQCLLKQRCAITQWRASQMPKQMCVLKPNSRPVVPFETKSSFKTWCSSEQDRLAAAVKSERALSCNPCKVFTPQKVHCAICPFGDD